MDIQDPDGDSEDDFPLPPPRPIPVSINYESKSKEALDPLCNPHQVCMYPDSESNVSESTLTEPKGCTPFLDNQESEALAREMLSLATSQAYNVTYGNDEWNIVLSKKKMRKAKVMATTQKETLVDFMTRHNLNPRTELLFNYLIENFADQEIDSTKPCNCSEHRENSSEPANLAEFLEILSKPKE